MLSSTKRKIVAGIWLVCTAMPGWGEQKGPAGSSFSDRIFEFYHEFFGPQAYTNPEAAANIENRMANGVSLQPPFDSGFLDFVRSRGINLMVDPASRIKRDLSPSVFPPQLKAVEELTATDGIGKVLWNVMPEWDQGGGSWLPEGRPRYAALTREQAYTRLFSFYRANFPSVFGLYAQPQTSRNYWLTSITDYSPNVFYAYELGADLCLLERSIDELGDLSTGIAYVRGAARQYNRQWGIDISTYRTSNEMPTRFDAYDVLLGGWSPSYLRRHYYISYMAGAHVLKNEATGYYKAPNQLDPLGKVNKEFADFALRRHPDVGRTEVSTALLVDHYSGFDPKHWIYNQSDYVWYQDIPYSDGDRMINNFFKLAYPNHWLHGQTPGAPFNDSAGRPDVRGFQSYLARGGDPRPYEPMNATRYGHSLEIVTDRVSAETLRHYKVVVMLGNVPVSARLREALVEWVTAGGTLVTTASQNAGFDEAFLGARVGGGRVRGTTSTWIADGSSYRDPSYWYSPLTLSGGAVLATGDRAQPLITVNEVGQGRVVFSAAHYLQAAGQDELLPVAVRLFDWLAEQHMGAKVTGRPVEFLVNQTATGVIVTVVNHSGQEWAGAISVPERGEVLEVREYVREQDARWTRENGNVRVMGQIPPFEVSVYAVTFTTP